MHVKAFLGRENGEREEIKRVQRERKKKKQKERKKERRSGQTKQELVEK